MYLYKQVGKGQSFCCKYGLTNVFSTVVFIYTVKFSLCLDTCPWDVWVNGAKLCSWFSCILYFKKYQHADFIVQFSNLMVLVHMLQMGQFGKE
jgi:hypothetical protein